MPPAMRRQVALSNVLHRVVHSPIAVSPEEFVDVRIYEKTDATAFVKAFEPLVKNHQDKQAQLRLFLVHFLSSHVSTPFVKQLVENKILSSILHQEDVALLTRKILTPHSPKDSPNASTSASDASRLAAWPLNNDA